MDKKKKEYIYIGNHTSLNISKIICWNSLEDKVLYIKTTNKYIWKIEDKELINNIIQILIKREIRKDDSITRTGVAFS